MASERSLPTPYAKESDRQVQQEQALSLRVKARDAGRRFWVRAATSNPQPQLRNLLSSDRSDYNGRSADWMGTCFISSSDCNSCCTKP